MISGAWDLLPGLHAQTYPQIHVDKSKIK